MNDFSYPQVQRINVEENYFGDLIKDPYRWLEETDSLETKKFIEAENDLSSRYIQSCPYREKIKQKLKELFQYPRYGCPFKKGTNYFMQINSGLQNQFVLYMMHDSLDAEPKVFFDPNTLSTDGTVSLSNVTVKFSNDGKLWAYGLQKSGSDWNTIKIRDVDTGKDLDDELIKVKFSGISWTKDDKGFFYSYYPNQSDNQCDGQETTECNHQKLFYHRINTSQSEDVLDDPFNPNIRKNMRFEPIVSDFDADYYFIANDGPKHYIRTNWNAPNFRVITVDLSDPQSYSKSSWQDLIPEHPKNVLDSVDVVNHNILVCHYIADVISRLELRKLEDGSLIREIKIPVGTISSLQAEREHKELFYSFTSFLTPSSLYHLKLDDLLNNEPRCFKESKPKNFDPSKFVTKQIFYPSKDGTMVPLFIVHNKDFVPQSDRPCLLYGYGGFNISLQPYFSVPRLILLDNLNGVFALANIRGGGEYGENWHQGGSIHKKQNCFDDFIYAADYLINQKYTSADKIIIQGGSNGGLLVSAVSNQRPDLFGCTICQVGVLDMLRYHKFTIGHAWMSEYGSPDEEEHYKNLIRYSPLHNIPDSVDNYPATLLLTADHDDRPELQHKLGSRLSNIPLMLRVDTKAGHGAGKPTERIVS
ncbi:hypothetical protein NH340_JMT05927 [Sarcoptes scabiei]|nr:hypothetical protein NH340_JMT05927 [Sarcoptes scabiei]